MSPLQHSVERSESVSESSRRDQVIHVSGTHHTCFSLWTRAEKNINHDGLNKNPFDSWSTTNGYAWICPFSGLGEAEWNAARESQEVPSGAEDLDRQGQLAAAAALSGTQGDNAGTQKLSVRTAPLLAAPSNHPFLSGGQIMGRTRTGILNKSQH